MLSFKSKLNPLLLSLCVMSALLSPALTQAEEAYESGNISANRAAEQRAALAKKAEERKKRAAERQKAAEAQKTAEPQKPAEPQAAEPKEGAETQKEAAPAK